MKITEPLKAAERKRLLAAKEDLQKALSTTERCTKSRKNLEARAEEVAALIADLEKKADDGTDFEAIQSLAARKSQAVLLANSIQRKLEEEDDALALLSSWSKMAINAAGTIASPKLHAQGFALILPLFQSIHSARAAFSHTDFWAAVNALFHVSNAPTADAIQREADRAMQLLDTILSGGEILTFEGIAGEFATAPAKTAKIAHSEA
jgi:hypothetical protein